MPSFADTTSISFAKTSCFGKCPTSEVVLSHDGFLYFGDRYAERSGTFSSAFNSKVFDRAIDILRSRNFFRLNFDDKALILDTPHTIVSLTRCGVQTTIDYPGVARPDILGLFLQLNAAVEGVQWVKTNARPADSLHLFP